MSAKKIDEKFDVDEEEIIEHIGTTTRVNRKLKRVDVNFPIWMVKSIDGEAERLGVTRQELIKMWLAERLESNTNR